MKVQRAYSPKDIASKKWSVLPWTDEWETVFGRPAENALWFVSGPSASGKSSFVMQLAKEFCKYGSVLYMSYEERVSQSFQRRMDYLHMDETQGRLRVATDDNFEEFSARLAKKKSARFVIIDSFQQSGFTYADCLRLRDRFRKKCFVFVSMEYKGEPMGKAAVRLRYVADVKVRVIGYRAFCLGRSIGSAGASYIVWKEGVIQTSNELEDSK